MITRTHDIFLLLQEADYINTDIKLVANDVETNFFNIKIYDGIYEIDYDEVDHASIVFAKPDSTLVQGNLTKTETGFTYTVPTNAISVEGYILAMVQLYGADGERISTSKFKFTVLVDLLNEDAVEGSSQFDILTQLIAQVEDIDVTQLTQDFNSHTSNTSTAHGINTHISNTTNAHGIDGKVSTTDFTSHTGNTSTAHGVNNKLDTSTYTTHLADKTAHSSSATIALYVNPSTGSNSNDGLTSGTAFQTLTYALSVVNQRLNHTGTINAAAGDYSAEGAILISGFGGKSSGLSILGDTSVSTNYTAARFNILRNKIPIIIRGFNISSAGTAGISIDDSSKVTIDYCNLVASLSTTDGVYASSSKVTVSNCTISNKSSAIKSGVNSEIYSKNNSGSGNSYGLYAEENGTIGKYNTTQPTGTVQNEYYTSGGAIR